MTNSFSNLPAPLVTNYAHNDNSGCLVLWGDLIAPTHCEELRIKERSCIPGFTSVHGCRALFKLDIESKLKGLTV
ncbi:hypothetical protein EG334_19310 [Pectobacterium versatile]|nr:hypothetical protein EG334_19310 [Pectobacterium versatile]